MLLKYINLLLLYVNTSIFIDIYLPKIENILLLDSIS